MIKMLICQPEFIEGSHLGCFDELSMTKFYLFPV
jgi:hypothetical protein